MPNRRQRTLTPVAIAALALVTSAHVGSPDIWYAGDAGPYRILVHVRAPGVIPGIADVTVQVEGEDVREVLANVNRFDAVEAAPPPDRARPVGGESNTYRVSLWVMTGGSNSFTVRVRGDRGEGVAVVPATIVAFRRIDFTGMRAAILGLVGVFLFVGAVTIVGAAVREAGLPTGVEPGPERRRAGRIAMGVAAAVLALLLFGGKKWWDAEDRAHRAAMFRPLETAAYVDQRENAGAGASRALRLVITDTVWRQPDGTAAAGRVARRRFSPLVPDHGKLMHLFAVHETMDALAHLHPGTVDTVTFATPLPDLPAGRYRIFADITHESGFSQTLTTTFELPSARGGHDAAWPAVPEFAAMDGSRTTGSRGDDAWYIGAAAESGEVSLADGSLMRWSGWTTPIRAGTPAPLTFVITESDGSPAELEPYMGMAGHAVIVRDDGAVFIHLHPMGTISAASQLALELRSPSDTTPGELGRRLTAADSVRLSHAGHFSAQNVLSFPYAFPSGGNYRIWIQIQRHGRVLTAAFPVEVAEGSR